MLPIGPSHDAEETAQSFGGSRFVDVPGTKRPLGAPQGKKRTGYPTAAGTIRLVMLAVDGRGGSILLTDGMCVSRISKSLHIGRTDLRREHSRGRAPSPERIIDNGVRSRRQDAFRKWFRLSEQRPRPEG